MPTGYALTGDWQVEFPSFETDTSWQPDATPFPHLQLRPVFDDNAPRVYQFTGSGELKFSVDIAMVNQTDSYWFGTNLDLGMTQQAPRSLDHFHPDFSHFHERIAGHAASAVWLDVSTGPFGSHTGYSTPFDKATDSDPHLRGINAADRIVITDGLASPGDTVDLEGFGVHDWPDGTFGASYQNDFYLVVSPIPDPSDARLDPSFEYASYWVGSAGGETRTHGAGNDLIDGRAGDDTLNGGDGRDVLIAGVGDDRVNGQGDGDWLFGQAGNDFIEGSGGPDWIEGGADDDWVYAGADDDTVEGGDGDDHVYGDAGRDSVSGGRGNDVVDGGDDDDWAFGGDGVDQVVGGAGDDVLHANAGDDGLWGDDSMFGEDGADYFNGGRGDDLMLGGPGADRIGGRDGDDRIFGGADGDRLEGEAGNDRLFGGADKGRLWGGPGDDEIQGDAGNDLVTGGAGNDRLVTDGDNEFADRFFYDLALDGHDVIEGFDNHTGGAGGTHDVVDLSRLFDLLGGGFADGVDDFADRRAAVLIAEGDFDADGVVDDARVTVDGANDFSITFVDPIQHVPIAFGIGTGTGTGDDIVIATPT